MSKAFSLGLTEITMENVSTTTMAAFSIVRLCTTENKVDLITTLGCNAFGVTQEAVNPSDTGKIAVCACGGISRVKMSGTAYSTAHLATTSIMIGANASGRGKRITTTTLFTMGRPLTTFAASDIIAVALTSSQKRKV